MAHSFTCEFEIVFPENTELIEASVVHAGGNKAVFKVDQPIFKLGTTSFKWAFSVNIPSSGSVHLQCRRLGTATQAALTVRCHLGGVLVEKQCYLPQMLDLFELILSDFSPELVSFTISAVEIHQKPSTGGLLGSKQSATIDEVLKGHNSIEQKEVTNLPSKSIKEPKIFSPSSEEHYPVWFGTNREGIFNEKGELVEFSSKVGAEISYGKCLVHIPESHVIGQTESGFWRRAMRKLILSDDDQALRLITTELQEEQAYWAAMQKAAAIWAADDGCAVVFLHGYNVSFENAAIRAAQLGCDLQVRGPVGFFSWPSKGKILGYQADESAIEASEEAIAQYLQEFAQNCGASRIHIIAHSMGNRGLLRALQRIITTAAAGTPKLFEQFILAAPDIDQTLFLGLANHYSRLARRTTLYVSNKDLALTFSSLLRAGMARVGLASPITIATGIDTVHVANVDKTFLGHGYVAEARPVLNDMNELIYHDTPPSNRMGLRLAVDDGKQYWVIGA